MPFSEVLPKVFALQGIVSTLFPIVVVLTICLNIVLTVKRLASKDKSSGSHKNSSSDRTSQSDYVPESLAVEPADYSNYSI